MAETILLVDDSLTMRQVLKVYLMAHDYEFLEAEDGGRALLLMRTSKIDLVVVDINMPNMDGIEFVREVRKANPSGRCLPIVLITGDKSDERRFQASSLPIEALLIKPIDGAQLADLVFKLLEAKSERGGSLEPPAPSSRRR